MDYMYLRGILVKERNSSTLQRVSETFYLDLERYVEMEEDFYQMRSKRICATELKQIRFQKIMDFATRHRLTESYDTQPTNLTPEEYSFYTECMDTLQGWTML